MWYLKRVFEVDGYIKLHFKDIECGDADFIHKAQDRVQWWAVVMNLFEFHER